MTIRTPRAATTQSNGRWVGMSALVFGAIVAVVEACILIGINTFAGMDSMIIATVLTALPVALVIGIVLCIVAGAVASKWRRLAVIGGVLMITPIVVFVGLILINGVFL